MSVRVWVAVGGLTLLCYVVARLSYQRGRFIGFLEATRQHDRARRYAAERSAAEYFVCQTCGPHVKADEDGCCSLCGRDTIVQRGENRWTPYPPAHSYGPPTRDH